MGTTSHGLDDIAVGVPVLSRSDALEQFIESVPPGISRVIIADNGRPGEHRHVYSRDWHVDIDVLDLGHDVGIGACRAALTDAVDEPLLWIGDCDMQLDSGADDLRRLRDILDSDPGLGGVSGWLVEGDTVRAGARDLDIVGDTLVKRGTNPPIRPTPFPHAEFDFIPHCGLFRTAVFQTYDYDPGLHTHEHMDFFLGQQERGVWRFASTPSVTVIHNRDIDDEYRREREDSDDDRHRLQEKWGLERTVPGAPSATPAGSRSVPERLFSLFRHGTPARVWLPVRQTLVRLGVA